jgi:hypothetical protein
MQRPIGRFVFPGRGFGAVAGFGILAALLALGACAGSPKKAAEPKAPDWTLETPAPKDGFTYFVGYADGPANGEAQATESATASLIAEIMRYIGVTITAESSATAKSTLDSYQADLVQTVKQTSTNRIAGFQVSEKFVAKRSAGVTVYILGRYSTKDLEGEKRRIAAVFQEKVDAVAIPEAEGKALLAAGDAIGAARKFIAAAAAAAGSDVDNASIRFERNIQNAKEALAKVSLAKLNDRLEAAPGGVFSAPFKAAVKSDGVPAGNVSLQVGYQYKLANGRMGTKTATAVSSADGTIAFEHPSPDFVGKGTLTMRLDLSAALEPLRGVSSKYTSMVAGLEDEIASKRISFEYAVVSKAREISTAVLIVDADSQNALSVGTTTSALLQTLTGNGFKVRSASLAPDAVAGKDDASVLASAKASLSGQAERFVYGTTRVVSVRDDQGQKIATVSAEVKVVELSTGRMLYTSIKQTPAVAPTEKEAVDAARRLLGQKNLGEELAAQLP